MKNKSNEKAVLSIYLGAFGIIASFVPIVGILMPAVGLIFSVKELLEKTVCNSRNYFVSDRNSYCSV